MLGMILYIVAGCSDFQYYEIDDSAWLEQQYKDGKITKEEYETFKKDAAINQSTTILP